jgi:hypothetical protein
MQDVAWRPDPDLLRKLRSLSGSGGPIDLQILRAREGTAVADGNEVYFIGEHFVVLVSPRGFPRAAAEEASAIKTAKARLPSGIASRILDIVLEGELEDRRSFVVVPRGRALSNNYLKFFWQKQAVKRDILGWLRQLAGSADLQDEKAAEEFAASLECLTSMNILSSNLKHQASRGLDRIKDRTFLPRFCPMHGDLWKGNIIVAPDGAFKVIDWRGSRIEGYGFFDLLRFAQSFQIGRKTLFEEIQAHQRILNYSRDEAWFTLLSGCGHVARNLGQFPVERFGKMATSLAQFFSDAILV